MQFISANDLYAFTEKLKQSNHWEVLDFPKLSFSDFEHIADFRQRASHTYMDDDDVRIASLIYDVFKICPLIEGNKRVAVILMAYLVPLQDAFMPSDIKVFMRKIATSHRTDADTTKANILATIRRLRATENA